MTNKNGISFNSGVIAGDQTARTTPAMISAHLPNVLSVQGLLPSAGRATSHYEQQFPDSRISLVVDFSGKTAQSEDGLIHAPVLTFEDGEYASTYSRCLS